MAELAAIRVLNVVRTYEKNVTRNGVAFKELHAILAIEGSNIDVEYDASVDIPLGWSGRALCDLSPRSVTYPAKNPGGKDFTVTLFSAAKIRSFEKGYKHPELNDIIPTAGK